MLRTLADQELKGSGLGLIEYDMGGMLTCLRKSEVIMKNNRVRSLERNVVSKRKLRIGEIDGFI